MVMPQSPPGAGSRPASIAAAEQEFWDWAGDSGVVIRLGGLYCDGRGPFSALARRGKITRQAPPDKTMALMHYDDAAAAVAAALAHPAPARLYLGVTVPCPTREEFYTAACAKLNLPPPEFEPPTGRPPAQYDVSALRRDLLPAPAYPDWRAALVFSGD
jgi:nucleoside-diphosphate-sugar epimerase